MLRKLIIAIIVANFVIMLAGVLTTSDNKNSQIALAQNETNFEIFDVRCDVDEVLSLNAFLYKLLPNGEIDWDSGEQGSANFGTLQEFPTNGTFLYMHGEDSYAVVMYPATSGRPYQIKQSGEELTGGTGSDTITSEAYVMTPVAVTPDNGGDPVPGTLGYPDSAVGVNNLVYNSGADGSTMVIRAYLAIRGPDEDGTIANWSQGYGDEPGEHFGVQQCYHGCQGENNWLPVTREQPPGSYDGRVQFTLSLT